MVRSARFGPATGVAATLVIGIGVLVLLGRLLDAAALMRLLPDAVPMRAASAVAFIFSGAALLLLGLAHARAQWRGLARLAAVVVMAMALLSLSGDVLPWAPESSPSASGTSFSIVETVVGSGRMATKSAVCFLVAGATLLLLGRSDHKPLLLVEGAAALIISFALLALVGYLVDVALGFQWWEFSGITASAAVAFVVLGTGLFILAWREQDTAWAIEKKVTVAFANGLLIVLAMIGVTYGTTGNLQETANWVAHTHAVRFHASELLSSLQDVELGQRGYLLTGRETFLEPYREGVKSIPAELAALQRLTSHNPAQVRRVDTLQSLVADKIAFVDQTIDVRRLQGAEPAADMVRGGRGKADMDLVRRHLADIDQEQARLAGRYQNEANAASALAFQVLPIAGVLSLTILSMVLLRLNREVAEHNRARQSLHRSEALFRGMAENMPQIVWTARPDGWFDYCNQRWFDYTGLSLEATRGLGWEQVLHPDDRRRCRDRWERAVRSGGHYEVEHRFRRAVDGTYRWHIGRAAPLTDESGRVTMWIGTATDIDDGRRAAEEVHRLNVELERRVHDRTAQLEAANREMESFSYSVSHDLRAPLRHVQGYVELLTTAADGGLSTDARHYLKTIHEASQEMGQLIDDLLAFSRISRIELHQGIVSLDDLVRDAVRRLEMATLGRNIIWTIRPLPRVLGDASLLRQGFINLIDNAIKYSRHREPAEIEIGCAGKKDERWVVFVRDNGAGFDMRYVHKLFGVFQRLHRSDEFEGTGIGLATVRRVIVRHGGRTWAEGVVDHGATFYLTLAPAPEVMNECTETHPAR